MELLSEILYRISSWALLPVVLTLLALLAGALVGVGGLLSEALQRRRRAPGQVDCLVWLTDSGPRPSAERVREFLTAGHGVGLVGAFARRSGELLADPTGLLGLEEALELQATGRVARHGLSARVAPMLGLMGTLIPLGPALIGLSSGHLDTLASNLVVAFGTTVVGLAASTLCLLMQHTRRRWYAHDLLAIDALVELLQPPEPPPA